MATEVFEALVRAFGDERVSSRLDGELRATHATSGVELAVVHARDVADVQRCLAVCRELGVKLHVFSAGRNLGYGSASPGDDAVVLDLRGLRGILHFDARLGTVCVEPGVTFEQLTAFVEAHGPQWLVASTGGPKDGSVLAHALVRGDGSGPHAQVWRHTGGLEAVLGDGRVVRTGHLRFDGARTPHMGPPLGPALEGLFFQSSGAVVTKLVLHLALRPEHGLALHTALHEGELGAAVETLRGLMQTQVLCGPAYLWNLMKLTTVLGRVPRGFGAWNMTGVVAAPSSAVLEALRALLEERLGAWWERTRLTDGTQSEQGPLWGEPTNRNLACLTWPLAQPMPPLDALTQERVGFVWATCVVPFTGEDAQRAVAAAREVLDVTPFEQSFAFLALDTRALAFIVAVHWERGNSREDDGLKTGAAVEEAFARYGYYPLRLGAAQPVLPCAASAHDEVLREVLKVLDPFEVLNTGRYRPGGAA